MATKFCNFFNNLQISEKLVPENYLKLAQAAQKSKETATRELLEKRKLPLHGWTDEHIEELVQQLAALDSNNFPRKVGLGEREARVVCKLVARRHYNFGHGIGRSGDLLEPQPKAAGSTLTANLTNALLRDLLQTMGLRSCRSCFLVPMATGMTLTLCLLTLRKQRPEGARYVLWSRIDQKSCFKSITAAGFTPIIVDTKFKENKDNERKADDGLCTDVAAFEEKIGELGASQILCLYSTSSCFAPRNCDDIIALAELAKRYNLPHLVNNAYGLQSSYLTHQLEQAQPDLFVQSTDKNLMVPVGGAIVAGYNEELVRNVAKTYAGRASSSQTLDVFMTLLSLGKSGYLQLVKERKANFEYLRGKLQEFAQTHGVTVANSKRNPISIALRLDKLDKTNLTQFGSMLYTRGVSGVRVIASGNRQVIDGSEFQNWGTHHTAIQTPYLTAAASLGVTKEEIDIFCKKLEDCWQSFTMKT